MNISFGSFLPKLGSNQKNAAPATFAGSGVSSTPMFGKHTKDEMVKKSAISGNVTSNGDISGETY